MTYQPSLSDIQDMMPAPSQGYRPSLSDLPEQYAKSSMPSQPPQFQEEKFDPSFLSKLAPNILAGLAQLGHGIINAPHNLVNVFSPEMAAKIPSQPNYDFSKMLMLPGTTADKVVQGLTANAPAVVMPAMRLGAAGNAISQIPKVGNFTANALSRIIPQAAFGAVTSENPLQGAGEYGGLQGALEAVSPAFKAIGKGISYFQPQKYAEQLINKLSGGQDLESVGKSIANNVQKSYDWIKSNPNNPMSFKNQYESLFNNYGGVGGRSIYNRISPIVGTTKPGELESLGLTGKDFNDNVIGKMYDSFLHDPTLRNAHELQSQFGGEIGYLTKNKKNLDQAGLNKLSTLIDARSALQKDMGNFMDKINPNLSKDYQNLGQKYKEEVIPYHSEKSLYDMATGKTQNPTRESLISLFRNPDSDIAKILQHQSPDFKNKIVHIALGQEANTVSPEAIKTAIKSFGKKGLNSYLTPDLSQGLNAITSRQFAKNLLQSTAGGAAGYGLGHMTGSPMLEMLSTLQGMKYSPNAMSLLKGLGSKTVENPLSEFLMKNYQPIGRAIGTNALSNE